MALDPTYCPAGATQLDDNEAHFCITLPAPYTLAKTTSTVEGDLIFHVQKGDDPDSEILVTGTNWSKLEPMKAQIQRFADPAHYNVTEHGELFNGRGAYVLSGEKGRTARFKSLLMLYIKAEKGVLITCDDASDEPDALKPELDICKSIRPFGY